MLPNLIIIDGGKGQVSAEREAALDEMAALAQEDPDDPDQLVNLGLVFIANQQFADAEQLILDGLDIVTKQWGADHAATGNARLAAAELYERWGKFDQALVYR